MDELKACPFCGGHIYAEEYPSGIDAHCTNKKCILYGKSLFCLTIDKLNTRPIEDALRADLAAAQAEVERLRDMELQADVEHEIWSSWMRYMFTCGTFNDDETWTMPSDKVERWRRQADTPYSELSEREKESDREQVRKHWEAK